MRESPRQNLSRTMISVLRYICHIFFIEKKAIEIELSQRLALLYPVGLNVKKKVAYRNVTTIVCVSTVCTLLECKEGAPDTGLVVFTRYRGVAQRI